MAKIVSRDEILEGYPKLDNSDDLFDSDILFLPISKEDVTMFYEQSFSIEYELKDVKVKFYGKPELTMKYNQVPPVLEIGSIVIGTLSS
jgi:hypothetical protein